MANDHRHTHRLPGKAVLLLERTNPVHGSVDSFYRVATPRRCNVVVRPATDASIEWRYDNTARQCARPYVRAPHAPPTSNIVKVARRAGRADVVVAVHPTCWREILGGRREIPGDVVALLCRLCPPTRAQEVAALRGGAPVCCYVRP